MNSKVDVKNDEDEDVVVVTSIITPTITTNTTIRQQDHLHIVSRWDANYTKKRYQGLLFDPDNKRSSSSSILDYCSNNNNKNDNNNIYVDRPPISPVRRRTREQHRITVAPVA